MHGMRMKCDGVLGQIDRDYHDEECFCSLALIELGVMARDESERLFDDRTTGHVDSNPQYEY